MEKQTTQNPLLEESLATKRKKIILREDTQLNQKIIDELEELFMMASPNTLMKSVNFVFFQYLYYADVDGYPSDFKHISEDFYLLQKFLIAAGEGLSESSL